MPFDLPPPDPAAEIFVSSHGMSKGIGQSDGPQIIPKASLRLGAVQFGAQWKNVTSTSANGEGALFANASDPALCAPRGKVRVLHNPSLADLPVSAVADAADDLLA